MLLRSVWRLMSSGKKLVNGVELYYDSRGNGDHTILCIPGILGTTRSDFAPQLDYFGSRGEFKIVAFDPRGHGYSRPPQRVYSGTSSYENDAKDGKGLMDALGIKQFSVLGWSDGGVAGMILSSLYPDSVKTLTVWGSTAYLAEEDFKCLRTVRDVSNWSQKMREPLEQEYGKEEFQLFVRKYCDVLEEVYHSGGDICTGLLANIKCPTLILHGMKDPIVASFHPDYLTKIIPGSVAHHFDNGKHNIHLRYAEEFNKIVERFLMEHGIAKQANKL